MIEIFSLGAFVLSQSTRLADRRTDRRSDRQMLIGRPRLQRGKNCIIVSRLRCVTVLAVSCACRLQQRHCRLHVPLRVQEATNLPAVSTACRTKQRHRVRRFSQLDTGLLTPRFSATAMYLDPVSLLYFSVSRTGTVCHLPYHGTIASLKPKLH